MIATRGAFGSSKHSQVMQPAVLTQAGIEKASRNRRTFNRALFLIMQEYGKSREETLAWLENDEDETWVAYNEANPHSPI